MADLKKLFKSAFYNWNFTIRIQEISPLSTKIATLISTSPIYKNKTNIPANQGILHFIHHMSEIGIVPCINKASSLDPPTKQPYIYIYVLQPPAVNMHSHKLSGIDFCVVSFRNRLLWHYATSNLLRHCGKPRKKPA